MTTRADVVAAARKYLGARWQHQARGDDALDCVGLLVRVGRDLGIQNVPRVADYRMHPDAVRILQDAARYMTKISVRDFAAGDALVLRFGSAPQHFGIVGDYSEGGFSLIHAYRGADKVVEHRLDDIWRRRIVAAYSLPGID